MTFTPADYQQRATQEILSCNLCGASRFRTIAMRDRLGFPVESVMCDQCSLIWISPRMDPAGYAWFYESGTYREMVYSAMKVEDHAAELATSQENYAKLIEGVLTPFLEPLKGQTLLDMGGSTGIIAARLRDKFGVVPIVVDPSREEIAKAAGRGLRTQHATIDSYTPTQPFAAVCLFQTVEHLMDVQAGLAKLRSFMRVDGLLLIDACDVRWNMVRQKSVARAMKLDHPFALTDPVMRAYLARAGFVVWKRFQMTDGSIVRKWLYVCGRCDPQPWAIPDENDLLEMRELVRRCIGWDKLREGDAKHAHLSV